MSALLELGPFDSQGHLNVVIGTPEGEAAAPCPPFSPPGTEGVEFMLEAGYVPGTRNGDGAPISVLVLLDAPVTSGGVVGSRLIGAVKGAPLDGIPSARDERLVAVPVQSGLHAALDSLEQIAGPLAREMERFLSLRRSPGGNGGNGGNAVECLGPDRARELLHIGLKNGFGANPLKAAGGVNS